MWQEEEEARRAFAMLTGSGQGGAASLSVEELRSALLRHPRAPMITSLERVLNASLARVRGFRCRSRESCSEARSVQFVLRG